MSKVIMCDMCKNHMKEEIGKFQTYDPPFHYYDLCEKCFKEIKLIIDEKANILRGKE